MVAAELRGELEDSLVPGYTLVPVHTLVRDSRRLDAEVYLSPGFHSRHEVVRAFPDAPTLADVATVSQPGRLKGIQVPEGQGVPFLAATQVFDIWPRPRKWLAQNKTPDLVNRFVEPGCILVTCSGTVGNCILAYECHAGTVISHDLLRVVPRDLGMRGYLYTFLLTRYGRAIMMSSHYGNIIKHLEVEHLNDLPIPIVDDLVEELDQDVAEVYDLRDEAYRLDMRARDRFAEALGPCSATGDETGYAVAAHRLFTGRRRLDAYFHNPTARAVVDLYRARAADVVQIGSVARAFVPGRFKRIFAETGTPYLDSEPVFKVNPGISKYLGSATQIAPKKYLVESGWLLIACSGQIYGLNGQAILANGWHEDKIVTQHILRLVPDQSKVRAGYLEVVLSHPTLGQPVVISRAHGTSVPELSPEDIEELPIPRLAGNQEDEIADMAERASELRMKANEKENGSVARLERELDRRIGAPVRAPAKIRPDVAETAHRVMMEATDQARKTTPPSARAEQERDPEAVRRGKKGGRPRRKSG
ncbi:MAG: hypothetical protein AB7G23_19120 [Vicinamibacterales bacterium]